MTDAEFAARVEELLAGVSLADRVRPRRAGDRQLIEFAGLSPSALYRKAAAGEIPCEKAPAAARTGQARGTGAVYFTLLDVARWRAARLEGDSTPLVGDRGSVVPPAESARAAGKRKGARVREASASSSATS